MDYVFQPKYKSEVFPNTPIDNIEHPLFKYFMDGDMRSRLNQPWNKVMYDIAPTTESEFRNSLRIVTPDNTILKRHERKLEELSKKPVSKWFTEADFLKDPKITLRRKEV